MDNTESEVGTNNCSAPERSDPPNPVSMTPTHVVQAPQVPRIHHIVPSHRVATSGRRKCPCNCQCVRSGAYNPRRKFRSKARCSHFPGPVRSFCTKILENSRFFVIKSNCADDIYRSIKYGMWCSTRLNNKKLDNAFRERFSSNPRGSVYLFFSVAGSCHFCGVARMRSSVDSKFRSLIWLKDHWMGKLLVEWLYVKDVPNFVLKRIFLPNSNYKPLTCSRDCQEILYTEAIQFLNIFHQFRHRSCLIDDYEIFERRLAEQIQQRTRQQFSNGFGCDSRIAYPFYLYDPFRSIYYLYQ